MFISIVTNSRNKSFSRKILRASRNSKLDTRDSKLETRNSKLETRASKLDPRFSKVSSIEDRVSSRDCQLTFERYCTLNTRNETSDNDFFFFLSLSERDFKKHDDRNWNRRDAGRARGRGGPMMYVLHILFSLAYFSCSCLA